MFSESSLMNIFLFICFFYFCIIDFASGWHFYYIRHGNSHTNNNLKEVDKFNDAYFKKEKIDPSVLAANDPLLTENGKEQAKKNTG